jgi:hypothetical protein
MLVLPRVVEGGSSVGTRNHIREKFGLVLEGHLRVSLGRLGQFPQTFLTGGMYGDQSGFSSPCSAAGAARADLGLSEVGILCGKWHLDKCSQSVLLFGLWPRFRNKAAPREAALIAERHQDSNPAVAKDTDQA